MLAILEHIKWREYVSICWKTHKRLIQQTMNKFLKSYLGDTFVFVFLWSHLISCNINNEHGLSKLYNAKYAIWKQNGSSMLTLLEEKGTSGVRVETSKCTKCMQKIWKSDSVKYCFYSHVKSENSSHIPPYDWAVWKYIKDRKYPLI
jgi:hypothetical protein